ncbi:hypothetical protein GCM10009549_11300 [Streptomyces thermoalcalitolerans]|uniref:Uncharacterized protein n=1 Tax=Streptomyces thermoalcalitolerans TaxID=65605 RepID=A0ABN1NG81_9ACTN
MSAEGWSSIGGWPSAGGRVSGGKAAVRRGVFRPGGRPVGVGIVWVPGGHPASMDRCFLPR